MEMDHEAPVQAAAWSPNSQKVLTASGAELYVWDVNTRQLNRTLEHPGGADLVMWNADGTRFLSADQETVMIWDTLSWNAVGTIELDGARIAAAWNANGTLVMTASGTRARHGTLAADTSVLPFGTVVEVPGYGFGRVEDRGGAINLITPKGLTSRHAAGQATTSFLVDVQRVTMEEYDTWRREYADAWNRPYDRASGLKATAWVERGNV